MIIIVIEIFFFIFCRGAEIKSSCNIVLKFIQKYSSRLLLIFVI